MIQPLRTLSESNPVLSATGWVHVLLLAALIIIAPFDSRTILGISPWIKPMKFSVSIVIYVWTLAWFLRYLANVRAVRRISWGVAISMFAEIFCIVLQAARGTTSHYNVATPLDAAIFGLMGLMVAVNTVLVAWMLLLFFRERLAIPPAYRWGIRLGLALFLFASAEGGIMIGRTRWAPRMAARGWRSSTGALSTAICGSHTSWACMRFRFCRWPVGSCRGTSATARCRTWSLSRFCISASPCCWA
jgi:hypothetical protein